MLQITSRHAAFVLHGSWRRNERPEYVDVWHEFSSETQRYVPEKTCRNVSEWNNPDLFDFKCSECGAEVCSDEMGKSPLVVDECEEHPRYCPNCGAKVVDE